MGRGSAPPASCRRVCQYFDGQGVDCDPEALAEELWTQYAPPGALEPIVTDETW